MSSRVFAFFLLFFACLGLALLLFSGLPSASGPRRSYVEALNTPPPVDPDCPARLRAQPGVRFSLATDFERRSGCVVAGAVLLREVAGLPLRPNAALMRCEVAEALNTWLEESVKPQALNHFDAPLTHVQHMGTYNCRRIAGSENLSQHSFANAIDISGFHLANGRRLNLLKGWDAEEAEVRAFWRKIHARSCRHFSVALGPAANQAHADHFHFDLGPARACR